MKPHKWAKEIKAWADGVEIEKWMLNDTWQIVKNPDWFEHEVFRIKPQPKKPQYLYVYKVDNLVTLVTEGGYIEFQKNNYYEYIGKIKLENEYEI